MNQAFVCIVIVNWNGTADTINCLESILKLDPSPKTVIVVDNGSYVSPSDFFYQWANSKYSSEKILFDDERHGDEVCSDIPSFVFIQNQINLGYAGGNNIGIRFAMSLNCFDFVWLLNNDTIIHRHALKWLIESYKLNPDAGVIGSTVLDTRKENLTQCAAGCHYNPLTTMHKPIYANQTLERVLQAPECIKIDYIYGASMFIHSSVFKKCGLLNDLFFLFCEEIDFCTTVKQAGYNLVWSKQSIVLHKVSSSVAPPEFIYHNSVALANYHETLSALLFSKKDRPVLLPFTFIFRFLGKSFMILLRREFYLFRPLLCAYIDFLTGKNRRNHYPHFRQP